MKESSELLLTSSPGSSLSICEDHSHLESPSLPVPCPHHSQFTEISCPWCSQQVKTTAWGTQILIPTPLAAPENGNVALGEMGAGPGDGNPTRQGDGACGTVRAVLGRPTWLSLALPPQPGIQNPDRICLPQTPTSFFCPICMKISIFC